MAFKDVFNELRLRAGYTQKDLSEAVGVSPQALQNWEYGKALPRPDKIKPLADALGISEEFLISLIRKEKTISMPSNVTPVSLPTGRTIPVPLLPPEFAACCGDGIPTYSEIQNEPEEVFRYTIAELGGTYDEMRPPLAVRADGACLEKSRIFDGDILVFNPALEPRQGQICIVCWAGALSAKKVVRAANGSIQLFSDVDAFTIDAKEAADPERFAIWGPVVQSRRSIR